MPVPLGAEPRSTDTGRAAGPGAHQRPRPSSDTLAIDRLPARRSMLDIPASWATTRGGRVLGIAALLAILLLPWAGGVYGALAPGGLYAPDDSSSKAEALLDEEFPGAPPNVAIQVIAGASVDTASPTLFGRTLT